MSTGFFADTTLVRYTFLGGTIMEARYKPCTPFITTLCAEEIIMERLEAQGGKAYDLLMDMTGVKISMTSKARGILMGPLGMRDLLSEAVPHPG